MHRTLRYLLPLMLATVAVPSWAADDAPWYQIEIVVFENLTPGQRGSEVWPDDPGQPDDTSRVNLVPWARRDSASLPTAIPDTAGPAATETASEQSSGAAEPETTEALAANDAAGLYPFVALPEKFLRLNETKRKLAQSSQYRVLLHTGWRQPLTKSAKGQPVHISTAAGADNLAALAAPLDGNITVSLSRYLHLHADLLLRGHTKATTPASSKREASGATPASVITEAATADAPLTVFRMLQSRRMRSTEIHYLDHPALGVIAQIVPVKSATGGN